jgi:hypothetical protein
MDFAIDGTIWEDFAPNPFQFSFIALLEGLYARGHKITILGKNGQAPPDPGAFRSLGQEGFQWLKPEPSLSERLSRHGWVQKTIPRIMKSRNLDAWLSVEGGAYPPGVAQAIFVLKHPEVAHLRVPGRKWLTFSESTAAILAASTPEAADRIFRVFPLYESLGKGGTAEVFKAKYTNGREYFLWMGPMHTGGTWIEVLKAFSLFKARQRSQMPLLLAPWNKPEEEALRNLGSYKYKSDVHVLEADPLVRAEAVRFAYALINNDPGDEIGWSASMAVGENVPLISVPSLASEWAGSSVEWLTQGDPATLSAGMMRLYTDERFRSQLLSRIGDLQGKRNSEGLISVYEEVLLKRTGQ